MYVRGMGQNTSAVATAWPTMPANVAAADTIITTQPYYNLIVSLGSAPLAPNNTTGVNAPTPITMIASTSQTQAQLAAMSPAQQTAALAPYLALWNFLPQYLVNAPIVDAWDQQVNFDTGVSYTAMGQAAQSALQQIFQALGITPPATGLSIPATVAGISTPLLIGGLIALAWVAQEL